MKLVMGLGNPGEIYKESRHNVGFLVLDKLAQIIDGQWSMSRKFNSLIINQKSLIILAKPQTFMNDSGMAVKLLTDFYKIKINNLWVIHDDLDLSFSTFKIQQGKGPKLHKGIESIDKALGKKYYWRVRVGIENRIAKGETRITGEEYVIQSFTGDEAKTLKNVTDNIVSELKTRIL